MTYPKMIVISPITFSKSCSGVFFFKPKSPKRPVDHPVRMLVVDQSNNAGAKPRPEMTNWAMELAEYLHFNLINVWHQPNVHSTPPPVAISCTGGEPIIMLMQKPTIKLPKDITHWTKMPSCSVAYCLIGTCLRDEKNMQNLKCPKAPLCQSRRRP